ncbi:MAG: alpha/beta hydrolase [Acidobacteria bacterium]|nr:alpha/beta hydrolase [Acidobacteriota bacterium]
MKHVRVNGADLAYVEKGNGQAVVLVHGSLVTMHSWDAQIAALSKKYHVISYSRRYHTPNPQFITGDPPYTVQNQEADLIEFLKALRLGPVHLVGHSYGGVLAALVAKDHPELVRSMILIEPGTYSLLPLNEATMAISSEMTEAFKEAANAFQSGDDKKGIVALMNLVFRPDGSWDSIPEIHQKEMLANVTSLKASLQAGVPAPKMTCDDVKKIKAPALLMNGEKTAPEFRMIVDEFQRCLPKSKRVTIAGANHGLVFTAAEKVNRALMEFLAKQK